MPAQRPRASFEPIPPDLDLDALVEDTPNFQLVDRISCDMIDQQGLEAFDKLVQLHVVKGGKPLVIDGYQARLDPWTFSSKWLQDNHGEKVESARDLRKDNLYTPLTIGHYMRNMSKLAQQFFQNPQNYRELDRQRVYLKDIDCPQVWLDKLRDHLPPNLLYLNESTGDLGGPGSVDENAPTGGKRRGRGIAPAGDLMSSLPPAMRAENLMCYIGHEGTYTPAHREMCASLGHNIMVECSDVLGDDGKAEHPGSSIWFMTESKDRHMVSEYWLSFLGHDIEVEKHFAQIAAWKKAPFTTYIVEQKVGDFILIPPLAPHQVWNRGTRTMKIAWNRTCLETLDMAFNEALPNARMVCRDEQYKNKAIVYYTLKKYSDLLAKAKDQEQTASSPQDAALLQKSPKIRHLRRDFKKLFNLYKNIMLSEMFAPDSTQERNTQFVPFESNITCAYCRGNIFNRFLTCTSCEFALQTPEPEPYDVCMECFVMGRSCGCISKFKWVEQFKWKELASKYEQWRKQCLEIDASSTKPDAPLPLQEERQRLHKKTLAQICQEQLKRRPWVDINKPQNDVGDDELESDANEEILVNEDGTVKKSKKRRSETRLRNYRACHVCAHRHEKWRMVECPCGKWWCYGALFRGHDLMPLHIMEDPSWRCPHCTGVCNAGNCRKDPRQKPHEPKGTLLGHDTKKVADARSVESLVDFGVSNLNWIMESADAPTHNARLRKKREEAERAKQDDVEADEREATDNDEDTQPIAYSPTDNSMIDPSLHESTGARFQAMERHSNHAAASNPVSTLTTRHGEEHAPAPGYQAAMQSGYPATVAPTHLASDSTEFNEDVNDASISTTGPRGSKRKGRSSDVALSKKRRQEEYSADGKPLSGATKQYRKEKERQALEEARKRGRYILTSAALRGKSLPVKLKLGHANMARIAAAQAEHSSNGNNDLLRSDVQPDESQVAPKSTFTAPPSSNTKAEKPKAVRIRIEKDEDFKTRRRNRKAMTGIAASVSSKKKGQTSDYEELEIDSASDSNDEQFARTDEPLETTARDRRHRTSTWQAQRHGNETDNLPDQLPDDWKEGTAARKRAKPLVFKSRANVGPVTPFTPADSNIRSDESEPQSSFDVADVDSDLDVGIKPVASTSGSIFSRPMAHGKKIKIVGSRSKA